MAKKDKNRYLLPSERQNQPEQPKKDRKVFKKVLKFTGLFLLTIVAVVVIGVVGTFLSGQFNPQKIYITSLTINEQKEYVAISDNDTSFKTKIDFLPATANQLVLTSKIITGSHLIDEMPAVKAGEEFEIKFAKDEKGITKGGEIEIKFLDSSQSAYTTLKVLIDVSLNSTYVTVESSGTEMEYDAVTNVLSTKVSTTITEEYCEEIRISADYSSMFNSYTGSWSESENNSVANLNRLKKTILFYDESDTSIVGFGQNGKLVVEENLGDDKYYKIRFLSPASSIEPFELQMYIYKTYHIETLFSEELATSILRAMEQNSYSIDDIDYATLNAFINTHVYENSSVDVKNNFALFVNTNNGLIELAPSKITGKIENFKQALTDVLNYVFVGKKILITVENVIVSEINNTNQELKIKVRENLTYTLNDVKNTLGISLTSVVEDGETPADPQILFNNLRKLEIILCEEVTLSASDSLYSWIVVDETTGKVPMHYVIDNNNDGTYQSGDKLYKKVEESTEIELTKEVVDGEATWKLKTLSPTPTAGKYVLLYRYRNNDITEYTIELEGGTSTTYKLVDDIWKSGSGSNYVTKNSILKILMPALDDKFAVSSIDVTWTKGTIAFNTNSNIENSTTSTFVLNQEGKIFTYDGTNQTQIAHGSSNGVYYAQDESGNVLGRTFTIGEGTNNTENNVLINPQTAGETLEYTMVKWFVPYYQNIVGGLDDDGNVVIVDTSLNTAQYYFMPELDGAYDTNEFKVGDSDTLTYYNPIPAKVRLKSVESSGNFVNGSENYFMEIGTGNMTLRALNAMASDLNIPLYAVIIQTDINDEPYLENGDVVEPDEDSKHNTPTIIDYRYVAYTYVNNNDTGHTLNIRNYVDSLKIYTKGTGANNSGYLETSDTNYLEIIPSTSDENSGKNKGYFYVSNIDLYNYSEKNESTEGVKYPASDVYEIYDNNTSVVVLDDGINNLRNLKIALYNYYLSFMAVSTPAYVTNPAEDNYPSGNSTSVNSVVLVKSSTADSEVWNNWSIQFEILAVNIGASGSYTYNFRTEYLYTSAGITPPVTSDDYGIQFYTQVKTEGSVGLYVLTDQESS